MFAECYVFSKQSQLTGIFDPLPLREQVSSRNEGVPSPEVTVPFCLVPSPEFSQAPWYSLPTHLCRFTVRFLATYSLEVFPGSMASATSYLRRDNRHQFSVLEIRIYLNLQPTTLNTELPSLCWPSLLRHSIAVTRSIGILTYFPSTTAFALALGVDSPCPD